MSKVNTNSTTVKPVGNKNLENKSFLGNIKVSYLAILMGGSLAFAFGAFTYQNTMAAKNMQKTAYVEEMKVLGERLQKSSLAVRNADSKGFLELEVTSNRLSKVMEVLQKGGLIDSGAETIHASKEIQDNKSFSNLQDNWKESEILINTLLKQRNTMLDLKNVAISSLSGYNQMVAEAILIQRGAENGTKAQLEVANEISLLLNRVNFKVQDLFTTSSFSLEASYSLVKDLRSLTIFINALQNGNTMLEVTPINNAATQQSLNRLQFLTKQLVSSDLAIKNNTGSLIVAKDISFRLANNTALIETVAEEIGEVVANENNSLEVWKILAGLGFLISLVLAVVLSLVFYQRSLQALKMASVLEENQGNANAVNDLLNQLSPIDNGDFTNNIKVDDKFISPIANRVDKVRILFNEIVRQVKGTSELVLSSAAGTDETSRKLLKISNEQFGKMSDTLQKLGTLTSEMDEISQSTYMAQEESKESKEASIKGATLVTESIKKMDSIRETIQESSKKIKKLGESAQAINEVTGLIQDVTKQIKVLALNAAIQAASSGESGREFAVVAQEVQRLAEDSENATKKIATIINDIQKDTSVAVSSMEKTTQEVVAGAHLTDQAGKSLRQIEKLANSVAGRVENASTELEKKSGEMANFAIEMKQLQNITKESSDTIVLAARQAESLKEIAGSLEKSVNTYKV